MWDLIVSVPDHCLSFYLGENILKFYSLFNHFSELGQTLFSNFRKLCTWLYIIQRYMFTTMYTYLCRIKFFVNKHDTSHSIAVMYMHACA